MDGFEEQYFPNACADEIEEFSAILPVYDVVNAADGIFILYRTET